MNPYQADGPDWHGLYGSSRDDILRDPASVSHPAKMSLRLLSRIIGQMQEWGWLRPGSCLVDPFAGTFSTGITWAALHPDNRACGIELEGHFVAMGRQNQAHAEKRLGRPLNLTILRGDSRHVAALLAGDLSTTRALVARERAALEAAWRADWSAVAFQPFAGYAAAVGKAWVLEEWEDREAVVGEVGVGSPPYAEAQTGSNGVLEHRTKPGGGPRGILAGYRREVHGSSDGQIGNLPDREAVALASPPYGQGVIGQADPKQAARLRALTQDPTSSLHGRSPDGAWFQAMERGYGASEENIDACPDAAACGSPPYEGSLASDDPDKRGGLFRDEKRRNDRTLTGNYQGPAAVSSPPYGGACAPGRKGNSAREAALPAADRMGASCHGDGYGEAEGQLERLPDACATSPPFEAQRGSYQPTATGPLASQALFDRHAASNAHDGYGENGDGQIGTKQAESYSDACLAVYQGLADAGVRYLALVVKCPTRDGKLRRLDQLTARLLRAAGYRVRAWRRAWLFEEQAQAEARHGQGSLFGEEVAPSKKVVGRLSFFRRLHLAKGGVAAKHEDVYFAELVGSGEGAAVASPPYAESKNRPSELAFREITGNLHRKPGYLSPSETNGDYGSSEGQIGNLRDEATP